MKSESISMATKKRRYSFPVRSNSLPRNSSRNEQDSDSPRRRRPPVRLQKTLLGLTAIGCLSVLIMLQYVFTTAPPTSTISAPHTAAEYVKDKDNHHGVAFGKKKTGTTLRLSPPPAAKSSPSGLTVAEKQEESPPKTRRLNNTTDKRLPRGKKISDVTTEVIETAVEQVGERQEDEAAGPAKNMVITKKTRKYGNSTTTVEEQRQPAKKKNQANAKDRAEVDRAFVANAVAAAVTAHNDPLNPNITASSLRPLNMSREVKWLGVMLDGGRHYFQLDWIKRMIDLISKLNYNLVHFRLTDDQTFNVKLESHPDLAYPTQHAENTRVYSPDELRQLVQYAKARGVRVVPEINIPGHAGAWAAIPGLIVECPVFICEKGYGVPLNVTHPKLPSLLTDVLREVIDIFDNPPYLHLGGDEVNMAMSCFNEIGQPFPNYTAFEEMLSGVLKDINYPENQVIRWEMTGQQQTNRAGILTHYWMSEPGETVLEPGPKPFFVSRGLYFDTNRDEAAWEVYQWTRRNYNLPYGIFPDAIVAGTFELDSQFWHERSVVGKLLAVSLAATDWSASNRSEFYQTYDQVCESVGFDSELCKKRGKPLVNYGYYRDNRWASIWKGWKNDICTRLTKVKVIKVAKNPDDTPLRDDAISSANRNFWSVFGNPRFERNGLTEKGDPFDIVPMSGKSPLSVLRHQIVNQTGIIMDMVESFPKVARIEAILDECHNLGMSLVQMRLADDYGFAVRSLPSQPKFAHPLQRVTREIRLPAMSYQYRIKAMATKLVSPLA
jgi:hypothetical protein